MLQHWPRLPRVANWPPKFNGILFPSLGTYTWPSGSALISNFGQIEKILASSGLTPSVKPWGADFNFCTNRNADLG